MHQRSEDRIIDYLENKMSITLEARNKKYVPSPIIVPDSFLLAMRRHATKELNDIEECAKELVQISVYNNLSLQLRENYLQLRLDSHLEKGSEIIDFFKMMMFIFLGFVALLFAGPEVDISKFLPFLVLLSTLAVTFYRPLYMGKFSYSTRAYRYCILALKRAQELKSDTLL